MRSAGCYAPSVATPGPPVGGLLPNYAPSPPYIPATRHLDALGIEAINKMRVVFNGA